VIPSRHVRDGGAHGECRGGNTCVAIGGAATVLVNDRAQAWSTIRSSILSDAPPARQVPHYSRSWSVLRRRTYAVHA
jgi:hypothetical protein